MIWGGPRAVNSRWVFFFLANRQLSFFFPGQPAVEFFFSSGLLSWVFFFPGRVDVEFFFTAFSRAPPQIIKGSSLILKCDTVSWTTWPNIEMWHSFFGRWLFTLKPPHYIKEAFFLGGGSLFPAPFTFSPLPPCSLAFIHPCSLFIQTTYAAENGYSPNGEMVIILIRKTPCGKPLCSTLMLLDTYASELA